MIKNENWIEIVKNKNTKIYILVYENTNKNTIYAAMRISYGNL